MKFVFHKLSVLTLAVAVLAIAQPASAGFLTQTLDFGSQGNPLTTPSTATLSFNQFDTTQGTLTGVTITLTDNMTVTSLAVNYAGSGTPAVSFSNFYNDGSVTISGPDNTSTSSSLSTTAMGGTVSGGSTVLVDTVSGGPYTSGPVSATNLSSYEGVGAGLISVLANPTNSFGGSSSGPVAASGYVSVYGSVTIDYYFTPSTTVPEPASLIMVALGLGGVAVARKYRRRTV